MRTLRLAPVVALIVLCASQASANAATTSAPPRSSDGPVLTASDANDLAQNLNDATSVQGICYGWSVDVTDDSGGQSGTDAGSSLNPSQAISPGDCKKYVIFNARVTYESNSSDFDDSVTWGIDSNLSNPPTAQDLTNLGAGGNGLLNDNNDTALVNTMQALPLIVSDKGEAPAVPADLTPKPASSPDHPTNKPGSDWLRQNGFMFVLALILIGGGLAWAIHQYLGVRRDRRQYAHGEQVHTMLKEHTPEGVAPHPPPQQHKPNTVVENWVEHVEQSGANLPPEKKAQVLASIERAKESGQLPISPVQMRRIRKQLGSDAEPAEAAPEAPAEQPPPQ